MKNYVSEIVAKVGITACSLVLLTNARSQSGRSATSTTKSETQQPSSIATTVVGMPSWFQFESKDTINKWITDCDVKAMTIHAYTLWAGITEMTDQKIDEQVVPVYETWWSKDEALQGPSGGSAAPLNLPIRGRTPREFEVPRQFGDTVGSHAEAVSVKPSSLRSARRAFAKPPEFSDLSGQKLKV